MVTSVWEVREAKRMCEEVRRELKNEGIPYSEDVQIGIMIETPPRPSTVTVWQRRSTSSASARTI